jgi:hypothetical protein
MPQATASAAPAAAARHRPGRCLIQRAPAGRAPTSGRSRTDLCRSVAERACACECSTHAAAGRCCGTRRVRRHPRVPLAPRKSQRAAAACAACCLSLPPCLRAPTRPRLDGAALPPSRRRPPEPSSVPSAFAPDFGSARHGGTAASGTERTSGPRRAAAARRAPPPHLLLQAASCGPAHASSDLRRAGNSRGSCAAPSRGQLPGAPLWRSLLDVRTAMRGGAYRYRQPTDVRPLRHLPIVQPSFPPRPLASSHRLCPARCAPCRPPCRPPRKEASSARCWRA